jgi:SAM-dependent methyltransferase
MIKFHNRAQDAAYLIYRWIKPVLDPVQAVRSIPGYVLYLRDWFRYGRMEGAESRALIDTAPMIGEATAQTPFLRHYFQQDIWAFRKIRESGADTHVDVGSRIDLVGFLTVICKVTFVDIRPLVIDLPNLSSVSGSILALPMEDGTVRSLSCLHVAEHIGLGRYGDALDPHGTRSACRELSRVLAPGGNLYFSLPVGKPRLCFNAHRIHAVEQILEYFRELVLVEFSGIADDRSFRPNIDPAAFRDADYACGLFHFTKR